MSAATRSLNVGAADPVVGPTKTMFAALVAHATVKEPDAVTGEFVTEKSDGIVRPTEVTVPAVAQERLPAPSEISMVFAPPTLPGSVSVMSDAWLAGPLRMTPKVPPELRSFKDPTEPTPLTEKPAV